MIQAIYNRLIAAPGALIAAGIAGTIVLTIFMEGIARIVLGGPMKPAMLICQAFGWDSSLLWLGEILHYGLGLIAFPLGYIIVLGVMRKPAGFLSGIIWGVILWVGAGTVMMTFAGAPLFWGFGKPMIAALMAHIAYGAVLGGILGRSTAAADAGRRFAA